MQTGATRPGTQPGSQYDYAARRNVLRAMWVAQAHRYSHVAVRFIVGNNPNATLQRAMRAEAEEHGDILFLPVQVSPSQPSTCLARPLPVSLYGPIPR